MADDQLFSWRIRRYKTATRLVLDWLEGVGNNNVTPTLDTLTCESIMILADRTRAADVMLPMLVSDALDEVIHHRRFVSDWYRSPIVQGDTANIRKSNESHSYFISVFEYIRNTLHHQQRLHRPVPQQMDPEDERSLNLFDALELSEPSEETYPAERISSPITSTPISHRKTDDQIAGYLALQDVTDIGKLLSRQWTAGMKGERPMLSVAEYTHVAMCCLEDLNSSFRDENPEWWAIGNLYLKLGVPETFGVSSRYPHCAYLQGDDADESRVSKTTKELEVLSLLGTLSVQNIKCAFGGLPTFGLTKSNFVKHITDEINAFSVIIPPGTDPSCSYDVLFRHIIGLSRGQVTHIWLPTMLEFASEIYDSMGTSRGQLLSDLEKEFGRWEADVKLLNDAMGDLPLDPALSPLKYHDFGYMKSYLANPTTRCLREALVVTNLEFLRALHEARETQGLFFGNVQHSVVVLAHFYATVYPYIPTAKQRWSDMEVILKHHHELGLSDHATSPSKTVPRMIRDLHTAMGLLPGQREIDNQKKVFMRPLSPWRRLLEDQQDRDLKLLGENTKWDHSKQVKCVNRTLHYMFPKHKPPTYTEALEKLEQIQAETQTIPTFDHLAFVIVVLQAFRVLSPKDYPSKIIMDAVVDIQFRLPVQSLLEVQGVSQAHKIIKPFMDIWKGVSKGVTGQGKRGQTQPAYKIKGTMKTPADGLKAEQMLIRAQAHGIPACRRGPIVFFFSENDYNDFHRLEDEL